MRHLSYLLVLCLAALCYNIEARKAAVENDLYFNDNKPMTTVAPSDGSGMGDDEDDDDEGSASLSDDEDDDDDNEGSGYESEPPMETCLEKLLKVQDAGLNEPYKPSCDEDGYYTKLQCHDMLGQCWCATKDGSEIDGTRKSKGIPKCDPVTHSFNVIARYELDFRATVKAEGKFKQMVKKKLMYSYEKTFDGNSVNIRINSIAPGSVIVDYDVHVTGIAMKEPTTSEVEQAVRDANVAPLLDIRAIKKEDITMPPTPMRETTTRRKPMKKTTPAGYDIVTEKPMKTKVPMVATTEQSNVLNPKGPKVEKEEVDEKELEEKEEESNEVGLQENGNYQASTGLMAQPGLLAGVIGGAVVGLLFAVLLVMFIVYRMRKKDEGSYALDEPKSPRLNTYTKAPNKEFYA